MAADAEQFRAAVFFGTDAAEPLGSVLDDERHVAQRLDVVHGRRAAPQPLDSREWRLDARLRAFALERFNQRCFLARLVGAGAPMDVDLAIEAGAENVLPDAASCSFSCLVRAAASRSCTAVSGEGSASAGQARSPTSRAARRRVGWPSRSRAGLGKLLGDHLRERPDLVAAVPGLDIKISGCPNGCGQHHYRPGAAASRAASARSATRRCRSTSW